MSVDHFAGWTAEHYDESAAETFDPAVVEPAALPGLAHEAGVRRVRRRSAGLVSRYHVLIDGQWRVTSIPFRYV